MTKKSLLLELLKSMMLIDYINFTLMVNNNYLSIDKIDLRNILKFISDVLNKKLSPFLKSEPIDLDS